MYTYVRVVCTYMYIYVCIHMYTYIHTYICIHMYIYVRVVCTYMYIYVYICTATEWGCTLTLWPKRMNICVYTHTYGDRMGLYIDFVTETYAAYKNGFPVVVGNCPGVGVGVSPMTTFVYGPHSMKLVPLPQVCIRKRVLYSSQKKMYSCQRALYSWLCLYICHT